MKTYRFALVGFALLFGHCSISKDQPELYTVEIKDMQFVPAKLVVHQGDTVRWINLDIVAHDVTGEVPSLVTSSVIKNGSSWELVVSDAFSYYCSIHMVMKGEIDID